MTDWTAASTSSCRDSFWLNAGCRQVYDICSPGYRGRCTAPLLVDRRARRIVSNESAGIVRNLNAVRLDGCTDVDLAPPGLVAQIDALNDQIYDKVPTAEAASWQP